MEIHERFKAERVRLKLEPEDMFSVLGVKKSTIYNWEKGVSFPDAHQLNMFSAAGADVLYIVTGQRSRALPPQATLPKDAQALLNNYDLCTKDAKKNLLQMSALLATGLPAGGSTMSNTGANSVQIGSAKGDVVMGNGNQVIGKRK